MSDALLRLRRIVRELKHRNVYRVALQVASVVFEPKIEEAQTRLAQLTAE